MDKIIITTANELESLIHNSVRKALCEPNNINKESVDEILSIQQAAKYLLLAKQTLYGFTSKNEIPHFKKGKKLYFKKSDLDRWLGEGRRKTVKELEQEVASIHPKSN